MARSVAIEYTRSSRKTLRFTCDEAFDHHVPHEAPWNSYEPNPGVIAAPSIRIIARIIADGGALSATDLGPIISGGILLLPL